MSGLLLAVGLAMFFGGLVRACTGARLFVTREDCALLALGGAMVGAALALISKGL